MLPRKLHLEQINRFHDTIEKIDKEVETETDDKIKTDKLMMFFKLNKIWHDIDDSIESLKNKLDILK